MPKKIDKKRAAALQAYYDTLASFAQQYALHEGAVSVAFQTLLADTARSHHWTLIPQLTAKGIRPDGTLKDPMGLVRGHWEAKDTKDDLDVEIGKKTKKGYSLANIIFEDTRAAVLIQNKNEVMRIDLADREQLSRLLDTFFDYVEPQIESFEKAVDDMLVQHLLTERLIREIFDNPEFTRRNVIAAEIEKDDLTPMGLMTISSVNERCKGDLRGCAGNSPDFPGWPC
jgi:hypothetical protein